jgi:hypothetical protein
MPTCLHAGILTSVSLCQRTLPCTGCGFSCAVFRSATGTFSDGSGSSNYANRAVCQWMIAPTGATQVSLSFTDISTESCCDFVRVFRCSSVECTDLQQVSELSGRLSAGKIQLWTTGVFLIQFTSDGVLPDFGFIASWSSVPTLPSSLQNVMSALKHSSATYLSAAHCN